MPANFLRSAVRHPIGHAAMSFAATALLLSGVCASPARAQDAAATPFEVVRPNDRGLTCEALAGEINQLTAQLSPAKPKPKKKKGGFGLLKALSSASPLLSFVPGASMASMVAGSAASMAQQGAMEGQMSDTMDASTHMLNAQMSPENERKTRLTQIFEEKRC